MTGNHPTSDSAPTGCLDAIRRTLSPELGVPPERLLHCLFVSRYQLELPEKETLRTFVEEKRRQLADSTEEVGA